MRRTSSTMDEFCLLYLLMILLMRSGDVETNPGPDRIISEKEFLKLSKQIEPSYYKEVGINLDISIAELGQIEKQSRNTSDALITVFTRWRDKQPPGTDIRALLAKELERSDLWSLSRELLAGSLVPKWTGAPVTMPGSQTQPLSPDLIKRCADDFKFKYRTTLCRIRADPLDPDSILPFNDMYTNLYLEEEYRKCKRPLEYRDLFDLKVNGEFPKRIMVQGEAGAGKTTFCSKIAWDWINDSPVLPKFVWVLVVPLCEAKHYTIGEIAKSYLSKDNPATASQITGYIRSYPTNVFIAFDGLDEFDGKVVQEGEAGTKSESLQPQSADQTKARGSFSERGDIALTDILCSDELAACPVLVTSRPWKVAGIRWDDRLRKLYTYIHVEGFSKENAEIYIHKYFQDDEATAYQLIQLIKDNDIISENMAPYPIYIAMLCLMWRELGDKKQEKPRSFQAFSQIFDEMFNFLKVHYAQKMITDLDRPSFISYLFQIEKLIEPVAKVAFIGLQENTVIFKEDDFEKCSDSIETACRVGLLSQEKRLSSIYDKSSPFLQSTIFFPHKLFQEYMAGVYLASLYELDLNEFSRLIEQVVLPRKEELRHLLYFTVSRDKTIANHVMKCMVQGNSPNQKDMNFLVDVSFESQDLDTAALLRGRISSLTINPFMTAHTIAGYVFTGLYQDVINLSVHDEMCGPSTSHDVAKIICSVPSLKDVRLHHVSFHSDFYVVLAKEGNKSKVQTVVLDDVRCPTSASSLHLVEALCYMPNLTDLTLGGKECEEEFFSTLHAKASTLQGGFPQIGKGNFRFNGVAQDDLDSFLHALTVLKSQKSRWLHLDTTDDGNQIQWGFLTDIPQDLTLQDDEAVISCDVRFSPSGAKLSKPIKVTLDHNAHFSNRRRAEIIFYTRNKGSKSFERISVSTGYPRCDVRAKDLDFYVDHFCEWWIVAKITRYFVGKRVNFTPYAHAQPPVGKGSTHLVLLCIYDDLTDVIKKIKEEMKENRELDPPQPMFIEWKHGDINIKLLDGPEEIGEKRLCTSDIYRLDRNRFTFKVKPLESGASQNILQFTLNQIKSLSDPTEILFFLRYDDIGTTAAAAAAAEGVSTLSRTDLVSDRILDKLSRHMPPGTYTLLCTELGIEYNEAKSILLGFNNKYQMATRDCLAQWKTRTGGDMAQLKKILQKAEVGDLVKYMYIK